LWCTVLFFFRELFRISISNYQDWFKVAITFWLQTFREECMRRMEKALEIEKDVRLIDFSYYYCQNVPLMIVYARLCYTCSVLPS